MLQSHHVLAVVSMQRTTPSLLFSGTSSTTVEGTASSEAAWRQNWRQHGEMRLFPWQSLWAGFDTWGWVVPAAKPMVHETFAVEDVETSWTVQALLRLLGWPRLLRLAQELPFSRGVGFEETWDEIGVLLSPQSNGQRLSNETGAEVFELTYSTGQYWTDKCLVFWLWSFQRLETFVTNLTDTCEILWNSLQLVAAKGFTALPSPCSQSHSLKGSKRRLESC